MENKELALHAKEIRKIIITAVYKAGSGHPGGSLSAADILTYLYFEEMNIDPEKPDMENRDRFVLSKGHGAPGLYAVLAQRGYFSKDDVYSLRKINSKFQGHPDKNKIKGVEMSTGSLGQGFSASIGMALADKLDKKSRKVFVMLGDGEIQEGIVWEAAMSAGHYNLSNLTAIVDWNGLQIDGKNQDVMTVTPIKEKFEAFGFNAFEIDGHDFDSIRAGFKKAERSDKPCLILAKTVKGKGVSFMENQAGWHGKAPDKEQFEQAISDLKGEL